MKVETNIFGVGKRKRRKTTITNMRGPASDVTTNTLLTLGKRAPETLQLRLRPKVNMNMASLGVISHLPQTLYDHHYDTCFKFEILIWNSASGPDDERNRIQTCDSGETEHNGLLRFFLWDVRKFRCPASHRVIGDASTGFLFGPDEHRANNS